MKILVLKKVNYFRKIFIIFLLVFVVVSMSMPVFAQDKPVEAAKLSYGPDKWIELHLLLQVQGLFEEQYDISKNKSPNSESTIDKDFFVRRARVILTGQVAKDVTFFWESDDYNAGKTESNSRNQYSDSTTGAATSNGMFTQDAYINYKIAEELQVAVGMILLPFAHDNRQSAVSLLGVDYNIPFVSFGLTGANNVWRDGGLEARGLIAGGIVDYRVGVFQGRDRTKDTPERNTHDYPRYTGRLQLNLMDPETGFFYSGNYLGTKKVLSVGGGVDYQQNVYIDPDNGDKKDYMAWTTDLTVDYSLGGGNALILQAAYMSIKNCPETADSTTFSYSEGTAYFVQAGFLIANMVQPVVKFYELTAKDVNKLEDYKTSHIIAGLNFFINGHNANIKAEYQYPTGDNKKKVDATTHKTDKRAIIQCQIFI